MTETTIQYFRVYGYASEVPDGFTGVFRRRIQDGIVIADEAYHPRLGWHHTPYWIDEARGNADLHLVEVDELVAAETVGFIDAHHRDDP